jgi:hypothetical protein
MKKEITSPTSRRLIVFSSACILIFSIFLFGGCRKEKSMPKSNDGNDTKVSSIRKINNGTYVAIDNPYKVDRVKETIEKYKDLQTEFTNYKLIEDQINIYVKIKVTDIPTDRLNDLTNNIKLLNFPLDAAILFEQGMTDADFTAIQGEFLYSYLPKNTPLLSQYNFIKLYEVYNPTVSENWLEEAILFDGAMLNDEDMGTISNNLQASQNTNGQSGNANAKIFGFLKPKKPSGHFRYNNTKIGSTAVPFVEAFAIKGGGFVSAPCDINGSYAINSNFLVGTFIFCKFANSNLHILPVDKTMTNIGTSTWLALFSSGAISSLEWFWKNQLPTANVFFQDVEKKSNYFSHIMDMDMRHRQFCNQAGILTAPTNLNFWGVWENQDENSAGTLMLPHILNNASTSPAITSLNLAGNNFTFSSAVFTSFSTGTKNAILALAPDIKVSSGTQYINKHFTNTVHFSDYSCDITKTILHELSHANMYSKVGDQYWLNLGLQEADRESGGNYGWGNLNANASTWLGTGFSNINNAIPGAINTTLDDFIELSEAWAEFLGENYSRKVYVLANPACRMHDPLGGGVNGALITTNGNVGETPYQFTLLVDKMESGHAWADIWIPCGMFHDLMDVTNTVTTEPWDVCGGYTIAEMYNAFNISRPAHAAYLEFIAPIHGYNYLQLKPLFDNNLNL